MRLWLVAFTFFVLTGTVHAQDAFPLASAQIVDAPDVSGWRQTATITSLTFDGSSTAVSFTKQWGPDRWPDVVPPGWAGPLQYTLWLCLQINGQWTCSGFVQFWYGRNESGSPAQPDVPSVYHLNYYYSSRWRPMDTHGPITPGERIGFLVTSGNARDSVGPYGPMERSNVVVIPATDRGTFTFADTPPPVIVQLPPPVVVPPVVQPPPVVPANDVLLTQIKTLVEQELALQQDTNAKTTRIDAEVKTFSQQFGTVMEFVGKYVAPAIAAWFAGKAVAKP
jgi:hypothetical protein